MQLPYSLELISLVSLTVAALSTSILSGVIGMGGGVLLLAIMTFFLPISVIVPIHGIVQLISNGTRSFFLRKHVYLPMFFYFLIGLPLGAGISILLIQKVEHKEVFFLLIAALIFYVVFKPKKLPPLKIPHWCFAFVGAGVGLLGLFVGCTGPFVAPFFLRDDLNKEQIVATKAAVQVAGHFIKIPAFIHLGFNYTESIPFLIPMIIVTVAGTKLGVFLLGKINVAVFIKLFKAALLIAGFRLVYKALAILMN